jgi:hypothetical protein
MSGRQMASGPALRRPIRWEVTATPSGGVRRLVVLSRPDGLAFARSVARVAPAIDMARVNGSHANRVVSWDPIRGPILEPWERARRRWRREVRRLGKDARSIVVTDVRACYPSISLRVVMRRLRALGAPDASVREIGSWLRVFAEAGVDGLPVGPGPSAVLAEAVLSAGDHVIRAAGVPHVRWVDDVAIFASDARTQMSAFEELRRVWASLGLEVHDGKTVFLDGPEGMAYLGTAPNSPAASSALR